MTPTAHIDSITKPITTNAILLPTDGNKDHTSRLEFFIDWLSTTGTTWHNPDLAAYRDYLMSEGRQRRDKHTGGMVDAPPLRKASAASHLSTIRGRYKALLDSNTTRDYLYSLTPTDATPADKYAFVQEAITRLQNATLPSVSKVTVVNKQDTSDADHLRLTEGQANALIGAPGTHTLKALRDTALIVLMLCSGIRAAEAAALDMVDLRQRLGGELALHVREGKGSKQRLIPYGNYEYALMILEVWLKRAGIEDGAVFRGFFKGGKRVRSHRLTTRQIRRIVKHYPVTIDAHQRKVEPHDLRRTYARRCYEDGMALLAIQQNLGHASVETTQDYIGTLDVDARKPSRAYSALGDVYRQLDRFDL